MPDAAALLQQIGFGEYESRAYAALLRSGPVNGSELARVSGIPRANIYSILRKLEARGAVVRSESDAGTLYGPVPPNELIQQMRSTLDRSLDAAQVALEALAAPMAHEPVWNLQGYHPMLEGARALLRGAQRSLHVAICCPEAGALAEELAAAQARGVSIQTLCLTGCVTLCQGCRGLVYRHPEPEEALPRWLVLVADGGEILVSEIGADEEAVTARTRQPLLVELASCYVSQSIALTAIWEDIGDQHEQLLSARTLAIIRTLGIERSAGRWLNHLPRPLSDGSPQQGHVGGETG